MSHVPIEDQWLDRNDIFGLEYKQGLVFLSVAGYEDAKFKPFGELEDIEENTSLDNGFQRLNDANGDDVLYLDKSDDPNKVIHAGIGHRPMAIRRFTRYPEGEAKLRSIPNLSIPTTSDDYAYVDGRDSPYEQPSNAEELVIPPGQHLSFDFRNEDDDDDHEPILNIKMRIYTVVPIDPQGRHDEKNAVKRAISHGSPIPRYPVGTIDKQDEYNMRSDWEVEPRTLSQLRSILK